jgi:protein-tyrosine phosphatase
MIRKDNSMVKVLFVCMGNICRSPSAEGVFYRLLEEHDLVEHVDVDSAGTHGYHVGEKADPRSIQAALSRGVDINHHRARLVHPSDFEEYDYILAMDEDNHSRLIAKCPLEYRHKVRLMLSFASHIDEMEVPDPYYGGAQGFERVLDLLEEAAKGLLEDIRKNHLTGMEVQ